MVKLVKNINIKDINLVSTEKILNDNLLLTKNFANNEEKESDLKSFLVAELSIFSDFQLILKNEDTVIETNTENEEIANNVNNSDEMLLEKLPNQDTQIETIEENKPILTKVIEENNIKEVYTDIYKTVKIKNESKYVLTEEMVTPNINYSNLKDIIIYHTHTCESYTPTANFQYESTCNYRTTDKNCSVVRVGNELANYMAGKGYTVIHNDTLHDYPAYSGSYSRSLSTVSNLLSTYKNVDMVFDVHRDALGNNSNYAPCVQIGDEKVAQLMFVIGTDGGGLSHPNWNNNLKLAIKIQEKANEMYPGLFRPIILRNSRYNQHVTNGSAIIEVGATGNTLEQCLGSMKYLSEILFEILK